MKQSIIDIVTQTAEYEIDNDFDPDVGVYPTAEITNAQEVAEDVIKAYLNDVWILFNQDDKSTWPLSGRYLTRINYRHETNNFEKMTILQEFTKHNGIWSSADTVTEYLDLENLNINAIS